jgi:hypothetical protein
MRVRYTDRPGITGFTEKFNTHGLGEVELFFDGGDATSEEIKLLDVLLEHPLPSSVYKQGAWVPLSDAFKSNDVITDNYNVRFFEPASEADKARGWAH